MAKMLDMMIKNDADIKKLVQKRERLLQVWAAKGFDELSGRLNEEWRDEQYEKAYAQQLKREKQNTSRQVAVAAVAGTSRSY